MKKLLLTFFSVLASCVIMAQGFTTNNTNGNLLDACGNNFIMKGMNIPLAWYVNDVNGSIPALKTNTQSNCLRIVIDTKTSDNAWQTCVVNCIKNKMIPMVELHDVTGSTDPASLRRMGEFWASKASFFNNTNFNGVNIQKHILVNLANEWGTWEIANRKTAIWRDAVINAIKPMRTAGIKTTIVIDAVGYGQDIDNAYHIRTYAKDIQRADNTNLNGPSNSTQNSNLLFSIHMYCEWKKGGDNIGIINTIKSSGVPIIVGEFGYQHASDGSCDIDEQGILNTCQTGGIGWLAWSQKGNGSPVQYLDLCSNWACTTLSAWGNTIINGRNGTKTAVECSVFSNPNCSGSCTTTAPVVTPTKSFCQNATATALSATGTSLKWYTVADGGTASASAPVPGTSNAGTSNYYVSQTLNGCESPRSTINVTVYPLPVINITSPINNSTITDNPSNILINAEVLGNEITSVQFFNENNLLDQKSTSPYIYNWLNVANGQYIISVKASNVAGCSNASSVNVAVNKIITSIEEENNSLEISGYPNPFSEHITLNSKELVNYIIVDITGIVMERGIAFEGIPIGSELNPGMYFLTINSHSKNTVLKIIKKK